MGRSRKQQAGPGWRLVSNSEDTPSAGAAYVGPPKIKLRIEKRRGKTVTVLYEPQGITDLAALGKELRRHLHVGGTTKSETIEIQGEHRDAVRVYLIEKGYKVKG